MKLKGKKIEGPQERIIVLPRQNGNNLIFKFRAVLDFTDFENLCPIPKPREALKPGGEKTLLLDHPDYLKAIDEWALRKTHYSFLKSIEATEDLEWENVKMGDPDTWEKYQKELEDAGLTEPERVRLLQTYSEVQGLSQDKIDEATRNFLAIPQADIEVG
jgi:hypothetical protein